MASVPERDSPVSTVSEAIAREAHKAFKPDFIGASTLTISAKDKFKVGDKVVYPAHGVGEVTSVQLRNIGGKNQEFYDIMMVETGRKIMVPIDHAKVVGLRRVASKKEIERVVEILKAGESRIDTQTWNKRFREYSQKINTGSVFEIAEVFRDLTILSGNKELSYGEKQMLDKAQGLLVSEISVSKARTADKVKTEIREMVAA